MTTYTFSPTSVTAIQNWSDPTIWSGRSVPNSATAEVLMPSITDLSSGQTLSLTVNVQAGQSFQVGDLDIVYGTIDNFGSLTAAHAVKVGVHGGFYNYATPGTLTAQSFENDGTITSTGAYTISGTAINRGSLYGNFTFTAGTFENAGGSLQSTGNLIVAAGTIANLSNGTLTGGTYLPLAGNITFQTGAPITSLAATVSLGNGTLQTSAAIGASPVTLQSSLAAIAPSGFLLADNYANQGALTVAGAVWSDAAFSAASLTIASTGSITLSAPGSSTASLDAPGGITDNGTIIAAIGSAGQLDGVFQNSSVRIGSAVHGSGTIVVGPSVSYVSPTIGQGTARVSLELASSDTANILFADNAGTLVLDAPQSVSGTIQGFTVGDVIVLSGISLSAMTGATYTGDSTHGTLTITQSGGPAISLALQGQYAISDFTLSAGTPQLSSSPPSIVLTDTGAAAPVYGSVASAASAVAGSTIVTSAADVAANLDALQTLAASGAVTHVVLTDIDQPVGGPDLPAIGITASQFATDAKALAILASAYTLTVGGATAAQAESIAGGAHVTSIAVADSAANIAPQLDALQHLAATGQVSSIAVTDVGFTTFFLSAAQLANDRAALTAMSGNFNLAVTASASNLELDGVDGHATTAIFSGAASQYAIASAGDGVGVTVGTDLLRSVNAVQFADFTDLIAHRPESGEAGAVTTGNVTELYGAVFGRLPDLPGLAYYQNILQQSPNLPLTTFAQWFLASPEYLNNPSHNYAQSAAGDTQFITDSYNNLLHRSPESGAVPYYLNIIQSFTNGVAPGTQAYAIAQAQAHSVVLTDFSASAEFLQDVQVTAQTPSSAQHWLILI